MLYLVAVLLLSATITQALPSPIIALAGPGAPGAVLQGPSAHSGLHGPDGSVIAGTALGGAVVAAPRHGGVVTAGVVPGAIGIGYGHGLGLGHGLW